jgi:hypothetical protein
VDPEPARPDTSTTVPVRHSSGAIGWVIACWRSSPWWRSARSPNANHTYCAAAGRYTTTQECDEAQLSDSLRKYGELYRQTHDKDGYPIYGGGR